MRFRVAAVSVVAAVGSLALVGCSTEARAERKGKEVGEQLCKAKDADNADEAQRHIDNANDKLDDLIRFTGRDVREDVRDQRGPVVGHGDVGDADPDAAMRGGQLVEGGRVPRDPDDGVAEPREPQRALPADSGRRAGDEDDPGAGGRGRHAAEVPLPARLKQV